MKAGECDTCTPILFGDSQLNAMAYDGCYYYFIYQNCVIKTDKELNQLTQIQVNRCYGYVCYDHNEHCFWAVNMCDADRIYQLDMDFQECDHILLDCLANVYGCITGLAFDGCSDQLLIAVEQFLYYICKDGKCMHQCSMQNETIMGLTCFAPGCILYMEHANGQTFQVLKPDGKRRRLYKVSAGVQIIALVMDVCSQSDSFIIRYVAVGEDMPLSLCELIVDAHMIGYQPCKCNFYICEPPGCQSSDICFNHILESIALEEAALAHILNAEGEKIQKAVASSVDINSLLCVNDSVNETIVNATTLEQTLYAKLLVLSRMCDFDCHDESSLS